MILFKSGRGSGSFGGSQVRYRGPESIQRNSRGFLAGFRGIFMGFGESQVRYKGVRGGLQKRCTETHQGASKDFRRRRVSELLHVVSGGFSGVTGDFEGISMELRMLQRIFSGFQGTFRGCRECYSGFRGVLRGFGGFQRSNKLFTGVSVAPLFLIINTLPDLNTIQFYLSNVT